MYEWTHDWFTDFDAESLTDPLGSKRGSFRVYRGGGWNGGAVFCRSAYRGAGAPTFRGYYVGFRLALSPSSESSGQVAKPSDVGTE